MKLSDYVSLIKEIGLWKKNTGDESYDARKSRYNIGPASGHR